jgi:hypothetical protein
MNVLEVQMLVAVDTIHFTQNSRHTSGVYIAQSYGSNSHFAGYSEYVLAVTDLKYIWGSAEMFQVLHRRYTWRHGHTHRGREEEV